VYFQIAQVEHRIGSDRLVGKREARAGVEHRRLAQGTARRVRNRTVVLGDLGAKLLLRPNDAGMPEHIRSALAEPGIAAYVVEMLLGVDHPQTIPGTGQRGVAVDSRRSQHVGARIHD